MRALGVVLNNSRVSVHPTPFHLDPTPYTLHPTPYTLHPTTYILVHVASLRSFLFSLLLASLEFSDINVYEP